MDYYWHFSAANNKGKPCLGYDDGRIIEPGVTHKVKCSPVLCEQGLHASKNALDALQYAPGPWVALCTLGGEVVHGDDKSVATERTYLWVANAEPVMREFARWAALQVCHLWDCPPVVKRYLETGNEAIRDAARGAAWGAARGAARDAARGAAWDAAWGAAWGAARGAAWGAAWDAAWDAARGAAWGAARGAAWGAQKKRFHKMLMSLEPK